MRKLIYETWENDVRVRTFYDDVSHEVSVERHQDAQTAVDRVAAANREGMKTIDGLGKPVAEVPVNVAIAYCQARGIPWERFVYSNEYDKEFKQLCREYTRLSYETAKPVTVQ